VQHPWHGGAILTRRAMAVCAALLFLASSAVTSALPAGADVTVVSGGGFGHWTKVGLFGGPQVAVGPLPDVRLPAAGAEQPLTAFEAAGSAVYGPAHIFGGIWPATGVDIAPPSGPTTVTTKGTLGARGSVTSTVDILPRNPPDPKSPGGFGPLPPTQGEELHATCTASEAGASGSVRLVGAVMSHSTTSAGEPLDEEKIPENPPPNFTRTGVLTNVGDRYRIVYNEQFVDPDGSITVNGYHMYLLGDIAIGDSIVGQVRCSAKGNAFPNTPPTVSPSATTVPPTTLPASLPTTTRPPTTPTTPAPGTASPAPIGNSSGGGGATLLVVAAAVVLLVILAAILLRRRKGATRAARPDDP
jgi:hypothetical protein